MKSLIQRVLPGLNKKNMSRGGSEMILLFIAITAGLFLAGGLSVSYNPGQLINPSGAKLVGGLCCDSGNGDACHPIIDATHPTITYNDPKRGPQQYGLLKTNITLKENGFHMDDSKQKTQPGNQPIVINTTQGFKTINGNYECGNGVNDQLWNPGPGKQCVPIPDEEILYVCKTGCQPRACHARVSNVTCYGDKSTVYDVYFRMSDIPTPGIPDIIKNCQSAVSNSASNQNPAYGSLQIIPTVNNYPGHQTLQLHNFDFGVVEKTTGATLWLSPYCKPVVYLYPPQKEEVTVKIAPQGKLLTTIPQYPQEGWHVTANPNGIIEYQQKIYDNLFYEASIPDSLIPTIDKGYVVARQDLSSFFIKMLPHWGLNQKEQEQFSTYWLKALQNAPYYFISLVPQETLNTISPLTIIPQPDTVLRLTLHFQPLNSPIPVMPPIVPTIHRNGFTVIEWGGMVKQDKDHPFTCLM